MTADGINDYVELGPGTVLQGLISKISPDATVESKATF
jgi:[acyl-carrier-protein] S-malonyltransferase